MTKSINEIKALTEELFKKTFDDVNSSLKILGRRVCPFYIELYLEIQLGRCHDYELKRHIEGQFSKFISLYSYNHLQLVDYAEENVNDNVILANIKIAYDYEQIIIDDYSEEIDD